jgi:hypothetical protein
MDNITTVEEAWDYLMENVGVSEETLQVVTSINGYSLSVLEDVLYAVSGEREFPTDDDSEGEDA